MPFPRRDRDWLTLGWAIVLALIGYGCTPPPSSVPPAAVPTDAAAPSDQRVASPLGADIRSLAADADGRLYAGTLTELYRWEPDDAMWRLLPSSEPADVLTASGSTLYAGSWSGSALHRVEAAGEEWTDIRAGLADLQGGISSPIKLLATDSTLYLTTSSSFVHSPDAGATWKHVLDEDAVPLALSIQGPPRPNVQGLSLAQSPNGTLYAGLRAPDAFGSLQPRLFRSPNGDAWTEVLPAPPHDPNYLVATSDGLTI